MAWRYESNRVAHQGQLRFERESQGLQADIRTTMQAYGQFLRGGVGLFHASDQVTRAEWAAYVTGQAMQENYPGIQGVGYNAVLRGAAERAAFVADMRATDWSAFAIRPPEPRDFYVPVVYLEPLDSRNQRAIGFDIYSEALRRAAVDRAIETGEASMTAKITLVQEEPDAADSDVQAGVLVMLPVSGDRPAGVNAETAAVTTGLIVSVFRLGDLMNRLLSANDGAPLTVMDIALYDAPAPDPAALLFRSSSLDDAPIEGRRFSHVQQLPLFGRVWTLQTASKPAFEAEAFSSGPKVIAAAGILLSLLLTALAWGLAARARQSAASAAATEKANEQIRLLMHEVNHRSKNLLAVVRAIARQTATHSPKTFVQDFSKRIEALSASNDTLVHNKWRWVPLNDLARSQLSHFGELLGDRINLSGPTVHLIPAAAQTIGMAVHELATNAGKHGALSTKTGTVDVIWSVNQSDGGEDRLQISWIEQGGPEVTPPTSKGFGSVVLGAMARQGLNAEVDLDFDPGGLRWTLDCPLEMVQALRDAER